MLVTRRILRLLQTLGHGLGRIGEVVVLRRDFRGDAVLADDRTLDVYPECRDRGQAPSRLHGWRQRMSACKQRC